MCIYVAVLFKFEHKIFNLTLVTGAFQDTSSLLSHGSPSKCENHDYENNKQLECNETILVEA